MTKTVTPLILGVAFGVGATSVVLGLRTLDLDRHIATPAATGSVNDPAVRSPAPSARPIPPNAAAREALEALGVIGRPADLRAAALDLLDVVGRDPGAISSVAAAIPEADRLNFTFDAIASGAAQDPAGAIALALALDDLPSRAETIRRIARVLGGLDPYTALQHGRSIDNSELGGVFRNAVLEKWANDDPDGFLAFVREAAPADVRGAFDAFAAAAASRPEALLGMLDELPQAVRMTAEIAALDFLVLSDIDAALAHIESLPSGQGRDLLFFSTARSYALRDPENALAWVDALEPPSPSATTGVFQVLAKTDPVHGAEQMVSRLTSSGSMNGVDTFSVLRLLSSGPPELMSIVADRFASVDDAAGSVILAGFIEQWSFNDPEAAYNWAMVNPQRLTIVAFQELARNLSSASPELAQLAADRIPPEMRDAWIRTAAGEMARANLDNALIWISRYEGQAIYDSALASALRSLLDTGNVRNPTGLAQLLDRQSATVRADSVAVVANLWAERDPLAAARWAERIELAAADESRRGAAFANIGTRWAEHDPAAAERWVLDLTEGEARDRALGAVLAATANTGRIDPRLIQAFDSGLSAQQSLVEAMCGLGRSDADLGRELIDTYITDPGLGAQASERLIHGLSGQFECSGFNVVYSR